MKKLIETLIIASLMLAVIPITAFSHTAADPFVTDLTADGGSIDQAVDVGDVLVWNDADYLYVKYVVTDQEWCLVNTHLEVATALEDIPQNNGNPIPGQFTYEGEHNCVDNVTYSIPLTGEVGTELLIAAHGVVQSGGPGAMLAELPDTVTMSITFPGIGFGAPSYFDIAISGGTSLDGMYDGYCVDLDGGYASINANVYPSLEPLPYGIIEYPENLDLVNWIINQGFVGQPSSCGGAYTYGDVQWAIWQLVENHPPTPGALLSLGDWSLCRAQEILAAAIANGEGFVPACGEMMVIILDPYNPWWKQAVIIWVDVPCAEEESAWGGDYFGTPLEFPGRNWAVYFAYTVQ